MKSSNKKKLENENELVLEISISEEDSALFKRLKKIATTHKLPNNSGKIIK
ncbi:MAG: hypothetical protein RSE15_00640 [Flavobacterium sp.]|uniref:hypothetical protein n=1 Tax=Flavobacterium sp. TaxID=239 RepID=UPI002B46C8D6|nr:hypothetical protein [Flavobacterium sp.]WRH73354.1 MAG: hypothetical protein RSE15_00640 [Flavobacterium sp.]